MTKEILQEKFDNLEKLMAKNQQERVKINDTELVVSIKKDDDEAINEIKMNENSKAQIKKR